MASKTLSRRELLFGASSAAGVLALLSACGKEKPFACTFVDGLTPDEILTRTKLAYSDVAADPNKACVLCQQFVPSPTGGGCGTCKIMKGPVHPGGSCKSYAAKG
jgi:hypothetical protein